MDFLQSSLSKQVIAPLLIFCIMCGICGPILLYPKRARAVVVDADISKIVQTVIQTGWEVLKKIWRVAVLAFDKAKQLLLIEQWTEGAFLNILLNQILARLTNDIVAWIQNGTKPRFLSENLGDFMKRELNDAAGVFIQQSLGAGWLCEPFDLNIKLALMEPSTFAEGSQCTISDIIANVQDYFSSFTNGSWGAFLKMAEPENNFYGAYIMTREEMLDIVDEATEALDKDMDFGKGYLSPKDCYWYDAEGRKVEFLDKEGKMTDVQEDVIGWPQMPQECTPVPNDPNDLTKGGYVNPCEHRCEILTPASTVKRLADKSMTNFYDKINEMIGAAASKTGPLSIYVQAILEALVGRVLDSGVGLLRAGTEDDPEGPLPLFIEEDSKCPYGTQIVEPRNGGEFCDDEPLLPGTYTLLCDNPGGGMCFITDTPPPVMSDGLRRCQGYSEQDPECGIGDWNCEFDIYDPPFNIVYAVYDRCQITVELPEGKQYWAGSAGTRMTEIIICESVPSDTELPNTCPNIPGWPCRFDYQCPGWENNPAEEGENDLCSWCCCEDSNGNGQLDAGECKDGCARCEGWDIPECMDCEPEVVDGCPLDPNGLPITGVACDSGLPGAPCEVCCPGWDRVTPDPDCRRYNGNMVPDCQCDRFCNTGIVETEARNGGEFCDDEGVCVEAGYYTFTCHAQSAGGLCFITQTAPPYCNGGNRCQCYSILSCGNDDCGWPLQVTDNRFMYDDDHDGIVDNEPGPLGLPFIPVDLIYTTGPGTTLKTVYLNGCYYVGAAGSQFTWGGLCQEGWKDESWPSYEDSAELAETPDLPLPTYFNVDEAGGAFPACEASAFTTGGGHEEDESWEEEQDSACKTGVTGAGCIPCQRLPSGCSELMLDMTIPCMGWSSSTSDKGMPCDWPVGSWTD